MVLHSFSSGGSANNPNTRGVWKQRVEAQAPIVCVNTARAAAAAALAREAVDKLANALAVRMRVESALVVQQGGQVSPHVFGQPARQALQKFFSFASIHVPVLLSVEPRNRHRR